MVHIMYNEKNDTWAIQETNEGNIYRKDIKTAEEVADECIHFREQTPSMYPTEESYDQCRVAMIKRAHDTRKKRGGDWERTLPRDADDVREMVEELEGRISRAGLGREVKLECEVREID